MRTKIVAIIARLFGLQYPACNSARLCPMRPNGEKPSNIALPKRMLMMILRRDVVVFDECCA